MNMKKSNSLETVDRGTVVIAELSSYDNDQELIALGYKPSFKREFSNLATVCVLFSGVVFFPLSIEVDQFCIQYNGKYSLL